MLYLLQVKRAVILVFSIIFLASLFVIPVDATQEISEEQEEVNEILDQTNNEFFSSIDSDITGILEDFGITSIDIDSIYNISFKSISDYFRTDLSEKLQNALATFFNLFSVVLLIAIITNVFKDYANNSYINVIAIIILILLMVDEINACLNTVISVLSLSANFMLSFIPIFTLLVSMSGNPSSALTYNTLVFALAQGISVFANFFANGFMGLYFCVCICFNVNSAININQLISAINKYISFILGLISTIFTGFLSIRNVLAVSIDSVSVKGVRFLISSLVPIVGRAISDAYSSIIGSINLIKGSVAAIGILVVTILNVPVILQTLLYYLTLCTLSYICDGLQITSVASIFKCFSSGIRILLLLLVFEMFVLIISTGLMISYRGGT